jgi:PAS domain S-box-containing protein
VTEENIIEHERERRAADRERRRAEIIVNSTADGIITIDQRGIVQSYNRAAEKIFGYTAEEVVGSNVMLLMPSPYREEHDGYLERYHRTGKAHILGGERETEGRRKNGTTFPVAIRVEKFDDLDGEQGYISMVQDITERKQAEERLEHSVASLEAANQELEALSYALAHDLKNPLLIVTNFSHQLHEALGDSLDEQQKDDLQRIRDAGRHMVYVIDDVRDLADANQLEINPAEVDLSVMGRDIIDDLSVLVPNRNVRFEAEPGIKALGDKTLLRLLLTNLLQNAWKYTGPSEDAWIELGVSENEGDVPIYHVRDNGIGFDDANREMIFQAFERLHTRTEFAGSGLGLATVERVVRRHGGRVWGEGVPGEGAVFRFTLGSSSKGHLGAED